MLHEASTLRRGGCGGVDEFEVATLREGTLWAMTRRTGVKRGLVGGCSAPMRTRNEAQKKMKKMQNDVDDIAPWDR